MTEETKKCPYCGEEILSIAIKCKHCESILVEETKLFCPGCGTEINEDTKNCPNCNVAIDEILRKCRNCGALYFLGAVNCSKCSYPLITQEVLEAEIEYSKVSYAIINDQLLGPYSILINIQNLSELLRLYPEELNWIYDLLKDIVFNQMFGDSFLYKDVKDKKLFGLKTKYRSYVENFKEFLIEKMNFKKDDYIFAYIDLYYNQRKFFAAFSKENNRKSEKSKKQFLKYVDQVDEMLAKDIKQDVIALVTNNVFAITAILMVILLFIIPPIFLLLGIENEVITGTFVLGSILFVLYQFIPKIIKRKKQINSINNKIESKLNFYKNEIVKELKSKKSRR